MAPPSAADLERPWYLRAFDRMYLRLYPHRGEEEAERQAPAIVELLGLRAGDRVLDIACGAGRHARALVRRGMRLTGVDLSEDLLQEARERSLLLPGTPNYVLWDARALPFEGQFEGAVSMFTSFGYFEDRADDVRLFAGARRALVPGGMLLVDFLNEQEVRTALEPTSEMRSGPLRVRMERRIEEGPDGPRVVKHVRAVHEATGYVEADFEERVRLYSADEVDGLLEEAGLALVGERLGDFDRRPFGPATPRLIRVAKRPGVRRR